MSTDEGTAERIAEAKAMLETIHRLGYEQGRREALNEVRGALIAEGATQRAIAIVTAISAEQETTNG